MPTRPIGIFDSGIGGLTVASAVSNLLPNENIIYFGDTAHFPYGDKSSSAIQAYAIKICDFLLSRDCKLILIACNSASAAAYELVKEYVGSRAIVVNVIDAVVQHVGETYPNKTVGLIGTKQTIQSEVYKKRVKALDKNITLRSLATPLLAPMIEEGFFNNTISEAILAEYLKHSKFKEIEALILGCTHYPLIKKQVNDFFKGRVHVIDTSDMVAQQVKAKLDHKNLSNNHLSYKQFFVSDYTESFKESTRLFFGHEVELELYRLWE